MGHCMDHLDEPPGLATWMSHLHGLPAWATCMEHLDGPPGWATWMDHLHGSPGCLTASQPSCSDSACSAPSRCRPPRDIPPKPLHRFPCSGPKLDATVVLPTFSLSANPAGSTLTSLAGLLLVPRSGPHGILTSSPQPSAPACGLTAVIEGRQCQWGLACRIKGAAHANPVQALPSGQGERSGPWSARLSHRTAHPPPPFSAPAPGPEAAL